MQAIIEQYLLWLAATNHSPQTVRNRRSSLERLNRWCTSQQIVTPSALSLDLLEQYRLTLFTARTSRDSPLSWGTQAEYLGAVKSFLVWCASRALATGDAGAGLCLPRRPVQLPGAVLNAREVELVLKQPRRDTTLGLRDRAMLELFYSSGLRRAELARLRAADLDEDRRVAMIRAGKGQRDRMVPVGARALRWIRRYLKRSRPHLLRGMDPGYLFLTQRGGPWRLNRLSERIRGYVVAAGIGKVGSCHLFRHTMATLLLEGGADVREVQEMLGHTNLSTTARYTHVSIARLQQVHARAHPAERSGGHQPT